MNELSAKALFRHATTQAAEGLPRFKWTLAEFERLSELGFFGGIDSERERVELVDGEIVPMHAKGGRHEWVRGELFFYIARALPDDFKIYSEPGWRPSTERALYLEPEMIISKAGFRPTNVPPQEVLLLIEVAVSSLSYDRKTKARIYASLGVREYWVVNATTLETTVHRVPAGEQYQDVTTVKSSETLRPDLIEALSVTLDQFGFDDRPDGTE